MPDDSHSPNHAPGAEEAHASTAAHGGEHEGGLLKYEPELAVWTVLIFVFLLIILKKVAWGPMLSLLDEREKAIADSLAEAKKAREEARGSIEEQQRILTDARREAQALLADSRADADRSRTELMAKAREEAEKVIAAGREAIQQEKRAAIQELRQTTVELALQASSKLLRERLDSARDRQLVAAYVDELASHQQNG